MSWFTYGATNIEWWQKFKYQTDIYLFGWFPFLTPVFNQYVMHC